MGKRMKRQWQLPLSREEAMGVGLSVGTMLGRERLGLIFDLAQMAPDGPAAEVGIWWGGSLVCWSFARQGRGPMYGIDLVVKPEARTAIEYLLRPVELIQCNSWDGVYQVKKPLAFVFIDAGHGLGEVDRDLPAWVTQIMPGGIIAFDDYNYGKETVIVDRVVDAWQAGAKWEMVTPGPVASLIAFRRPV
jgi:hypothetical protein